MLPTKVGFATKREATRAAEAWNVEHQFQFIGYMVVKTESSMGVETSAFCVWVPSLGWKPWQRSTFNDGTPICCGSHDCTCNQQPEEP